MEYSNTANSQGIIQDVDFLCGTNSSSYPVADKTRNINHAYHDINRLIWECCDYWQYDDANATAFPISTTTLVHGQQDYSIPSTAQRIRRIEVENLAGDWVKLNPLIEEDIGVALTEYLETAGLPAYYDMVDNSIFLYPKPSSAYCTLTSGLKVYYDRDIIEFTTASTTTIPGFATPFHRLLSLQAAIDFEEDAGRRNLFLIEKQNLVEGLKRFYGKRELEEDTRIRPSGQRRWKQYL